MKKNIAAAAAAIALAVTGCGVNTNEVLATLDGANITLGVPYFMAQSRAAIVDGNLLAYYGTDMWNQDVTGSGITLEQQFKEDLVDEIQELYLLREHASDYGVELTAEQTAEIESAADAFLEQNSNDAKKKLGATRETVSGYFTLAKYQVLVEDAIEAGADTEVSDDIANQKTFSYIHVPADYNPASDEETDETAAEMTTEETTEETSTVAADTALGLSVMASGQTLEELVEGDDTLSVESGSYGAADLTEDGNTTGLDLAVLQALEKLTDGDVTDEPVATESNGYYILRLDSSFDQAATDSKRESVIEERKQDLYDTTVQGWKDSCEWTFNDSVWEKVSFKNLYNVVTEKTDDAAAASETDAADSGETQILD